MSAAEACVPDNIQRFSSLPLLCSVFFLCAAGLFVSCSTGAPSFASIDSRVIFDYADSVSAPSMRLAVFVQVNKGGERSRSDAQGSLSVSAPGTGYVWECTSMQDAGFSGGGWWSGTAAFRPPPGTVLPEGQYQLEYTDAGGRSCRESFSVSYPAELAQQNLSALQRIAESRRQTLSAWYRQDGTLLFFGEDNRNAPLPQDASVLRTCVLIDGGSTVCMLPPQAG